MESSTNAAQYGGNKVSGIVILLYCLICIVVLLQTCRLGCMKKVTERNVDS